MSDDFTPPVPDDGESTPAPLPVPEERDPWVVSDEPHDAGSPPPPPPPPGQYVSEAPEDGKRYNTQTVVWTAVVSTVGAAIASILIIAVPILIIVSGIMTARATTVTSRSTWMGILIGSGAGLLLFAGICVAILNGGNSGGI